MAAVITASLVVVGFLAFPFRASLVATPYTAVGAFAVALELARTGDVRRALALVLLWAGGWWLRVILFRSVTIRLLVQVAHRQRPHELALRRRRWRDLVAYGLIERLRDGRYAVTPRGRSVAAHTRRLAGA